MSTPSWKLNGQYYETCSCDFICPCLPGRMAVQPTKGTCTFAMAFHIERGNYGSVSLDGLSYIVIGLTPEAMGKGNWSVGMIVDDRATVEQREAIATIASGAAGGPMSVLSGLIGNFLGVESAQIQIDNGGNKWSVKASNQVDMAAEAAMGLDPNAKEPMRLINTGHPAANSFTLAHASKSHLHSLGIAWDDVTGKNNGQYAPFSWQSA